MAETPADTGDDLEGLCDLCDAELDNPEAEEDTKPGTCRVCGSAYCGDCSMMGAAGNLCTDCGTMLVAEQTRVTLFMASEDAPWVPQGEEAQAPVIEYVKSLLPPQAEGE